MLITIKELLADAGQAVTKMTIAQAAPLLRGSDHLLIDLREHQEVQKLPVTGALHIPRGVLEMQLLEKFNDPQRAIFLHCASGGRATLAAEQLQRLGYQQVVAITSKVEDIATCLGESGNDK
jgi:rhodanese-related sulfurtransferase